MLIIKVSGVGMCRVDRLVLATSGVRILPAPVRHEVLPEGTNPSPVAHGSNLLNLVDKGCAHIWQKTSMQSPSR